MPASHARREHLGSIPAEFETKNPLPLRVWRGGKLPALRSLLRLAGEIFTGPARVKLRPHHLTCGIDRDSHPNLYMSLDGFAGTPGNIGDDALDDFITTCGSSLRSCGRLFPGNHRRRLRISIGWSRCFLLGSGRRLPGCGRSRNLIGVALHKVHSARNHNGNHKAPNPPVRGTWLLNRNRRRLLFFLLRHQLRRRSHRLFFGRRTPRSQLCRDFTDPPALLRIAPQAVAGNIEKGRGQPLRQPEFSLLV